MATSYIVSEIKNICRKSRFFIPFLHNNSPEKNGIECFRAANFTTEPDTRYLAGNVLDSGEVYVQHTHVTDRQTYRLTDRLTEK